jgi:hypothetical protein
MWRYYDRLSYSYAAMILLLEMVGWFLVRGWLCVGVHLRNVHTHCEALRSAETLISFF